MFDFRDKIKAEFLGQDDDQDQPSFSLFKRLKQSSLLLPSIFLILLIAGTVSAFTLANINQDVRQYAASSCCGESDYGDCADDGSQSHTWQQGWDACRSGGCAACRNTTAVEQEQNNIAYNQGNNSSGLCTPDERKGCGTDGCYGFQQKICQPGGEWGPCVNSTICGYVISDQKTDDGNSSDETQGVGGTVCTNAGGDCSGGKTCCEGFSCNTNIYRCVKDDTGVAKVDLSKVSCIASGGSCSSDTDCCNRDQGFNCDPSLKRCVKDNTGSAIQSGCTSAGGTCSVDTDCCGSDFFCDPLVKKCVADSINVNKTSDNRMTVGETCSNVGTCVNDASKCCNGLASVSTSCSESNRATPLICDSSGSVGNGEQKFACIANGNCTASSDNCCSGTAVLNSDCARKDSTLAYSCTAEVKVTNLTADGSQSEETTQDQNVQIDTISDQVSATNQHFMNAAGDDDQYTWGTTQASSCQTMKLYRYHCPQGLETVNGVQGVCMKDKTEMPLEVEAGAKIDYAGFMSRSCGAYQFDLEGSVGSCGAVTFNFAPCEEKVVALVTINPKEYEVKANTGVTLTKLTVDTVSLKDVKDTFTQVGQEVVATVRVLDEEAEKTTDTVETVKNTESETNAKTAEKIKTPEKVTATVRILRFFTDNPFTNFFKGIFGRSNEEVEEPEKPVEEVSVPKVQETTVEVSNLDYPDVDTNLYIDPENKTVSYNVYNSSSWEFKQNGKDYLPEIDGTMHTFYFSNTLDAESTISTINGTYTNPDNADQKLEGTITYDNEANELTLAEYGNMNVGKEGIKSIELKPGSPAYCNLTDNSETNAYELRFPAVNEYLENPQKEKCEVTIAFSEN